MLERALSLKRSVLRENDARIVNTKHNMAGAFFNLNRLQEAKELYNDCLKERRKSLGNGDRDTLSTMMNLGELLSLSKEIYDQAENLFAEVLQTEKITFEKKQSIRLS